MAENWELPSEELLESRRQWTDSENEINKASSKIDGVKLPKRIIKARHLIPFFNERIHNCHDVVLSRKRTASKTLKFAPMMFGL